MNELIEHRVKTESNLNFELERVLSNLDRAESWVRYEHDLYSDVLKSKNKNKITKYKASYDEAIKIRNDDRQEIRDYLEIGKIRNFTIRNHILKNLENRGFV